jgi:hypothetical protein
MVTPLACAAPVAGKMHEIGMTVGGVAACDFDDVGRTDLFFAKGVSFERY